MLHGILKLALRKVFVFYIQPSESKQQYDNRHIHLPRDVCVCECMYVCMIVVCFMYVYMYVCMHVCMYVCVYVCM